MRAAKDIAENGRFDALSDLPTMSEITARRVEARRRHGETPETPAICQSISNEFQQLATQLQSRLPVAIGAQAFALRKR